MATNDPFAKERANLSSGIGDEAGNLSSALGLNRPVVKPPLPTGPKPAPTFPTPSQIGSMPGGSDTPTPINSEPDIGKIAALRGSTDENAVRSGLGIASEQQYKASAEAARLEQINLEKTTEREAKLARDITDKAKIEESQREAKTGQHKEFAPTQESVKDLAMLFGLVSMSAFSSGGEGRYSGMAAMKNMASAMQGYREGRNEIFNKELKEYDKNMAALKANNDLAQKTYDNAMKLLSLDKDAGLAEMKRLAALDNNGAVSMKIRAHDWEGVGKILEFQAESIKKTTAQREKLAAEAKAKSDALTEKRRHDQLMEEIARDRLNGRQEKYGAPYIAPDGTAYVQNPKTGVFEEAVGLPKGIQKLGTLGKGAGNSGTAGGQVDRLTQSMTQVSGAIKSLASLPVVTTGPMFAEKNFNSIFTAPLSALNQKMSAESAQMLQTRMAGVARNLASLETGGAATGLVGLAQSIQDGVGIKAGAKLYVALDKLAEMRRIVDDSARAAYASSKYTEDQKNLVRQNVEIVHMAIPFTQEDITNVLKVSEGKSPKIAKEDRNLSFTEFVDKHGMGKTEEPASNEGRSKARPGEKVFEDANGNKAVLRNNVYVEVE